MNQLHADKQLILHCDNCGGSFFEENSINRISSQTAFELSQNKQSDEISGDKKFCPKDAHQLEIVAHSEESLPPDVTLLRCPSCKGIFAFPDDLVNFKKAQEAKVNYLAAWKIPLGSLRSVVILSVVAFLSAMLFTVALYSRPSSRSQAKDIVKSVYVNQSGAYILLSFQTSLPMKSQIIIDDRTTATVITKTIDVEPKTVHQITLSGLNLNHSIYYQLLLTDREEKQVKTEVVKLQVTN